MIADMLQIRDLGWVAFDDGKPTTDGRWCVLLLRDPKETVSYTHLVASERKKASMGVTTSI